MNNLLRISLVGALVSGALGVVGEVAGQPSVGMESVRAGDEVKVTRRAKDLVPVMSATLQAQALPKAVQQEAASEGIGPQMVGYGREVSGVFAKVLKPGDLDWSDTADGGKAAVIRLCSPGAAGLRVALLSYSMPAEAELRFFPPDDAGAQVLEVTGAQINASLARDSLTRDPDAPDPLLFWGPATDGECQEIEFFLPKGVDVSELSFAIPTLSHLFVPPALGPATVPLSITDSQTCSLDYTCYTNALGNVGPAVARMLFTEGGATYSCTGTLLNDMDPDSQIPYFLTARHCISSQSVASTLQTYWFFRTASCNGPFNNDVAIRSGGSMLLASIAKTDTTLLRLNDTPPNGAVLAGWDTGVPDATQPLVSISHPAGDLKKVAFGFYKGEANCAVPDNDVYIYCMGSNAGSFFEIQFYHGSTEGGSSGSGLFRPDNHQLIGTLTGGNQSCDYPEGTDFYGRFDVAYGEGLSTWLAETDPCKFSPGDWNYCSDPACGPCDEGEGDCDNDQDCAAGLVCATDDEFGGEVDVCQVPPDEPAAETCRRTPGDWDYCSDPNCGPCASGEGDCDSHAECQGDLLCLPDTGADHNFGATVDTCGTRPDGLCFLRSGDWGFCSSLTCGPCAEGQGDCDSDTDCNAGLVCAFNVGADYGLPADMDVCEAPTAQTCTRSVGDWGYCADPACGPCTAGQGDCDGNDQCAEGLVCSFNAGERYGLPPTQDVCEAPAQ